MRGAAGTAFEISDTATAQTGPLGQGFLREATQRPVTAKQTAETLLAGR
jgi:hypothetical protein